MPLAPPCTSNVSPAMSLARSNTLLHTVKNVSGSASGYQSANGVTNSQAAASEVAAFNNPRDLEARNVGCPGRRRIGTHALQNIRAIDARRVDANQGFAGAQLRRGSLSRPQHVRAARLGDFNCAHR